MLPVCRQEDIVQAVATLHQLHSTQQQRIAAVQLLEQLKHGDVQSSAKIAVGLLVGNNPVEVQLAGYQLLTFLAASRWQEFSEADHKNLVDVAAQHLQTVGAVQASWPLKSHSAVLLATVVKQRGADALTSILPELLQYGQGGLMNTQLVCMVLKHVAEEVTQYHDDMNEEAKRKLLSALTSSLHSVLPFLVSAMERHFENVMRCLQSGQQSEAEQHAAVVTTALGTAAVYCEWSPLGRLGACGVVTAASFLITTLEFREAACEVLRQVSQRKQVGEEKDVYRQIMNDVGNSLVRAAASLLQPTEVDELDYEGRHDAFGRRLCDTMVTFGTSHLACIASRETQTLYLQQMMQFSQHRYLLLSNTALPFWVDLLRAAAEKKNHSSQVHLPPECVAALMDLAGLKMQAGVHVDDKADDAPPYFDDFQEYKALCTAYRSKLVQVVRSTALLLPDQALEAAARRVDIALTACCSGSVPYSEQQTEIEAGVTFLEAVISAVADKHVSNNAQSQHTQVVLPSMERIYQRIMSCEISDPYLLFFYAKGLEAFHPLLHERPQLVGPTIHKVFHLLSLIPITGQVIPPPRVSRAWKDVFNARQKISGVLLTASKNHPGVLVPHLPALVNQVAAMWGAGQLRAGERNSLSESMLASGQAVESMRGQILEWVLSPVRDDWSSAAFLHSVSSPQSFCSTYMPMAQDAAGELQVLGSEARWTLYHHMHLLFRTLMRLPAWNTVDVLGAHTQWAVPPLLQICSCLHALGTPQVHEQLSPLAPAFDMSPAEKALYLKSGGQLMKGAEEDMTDTLASPTLSALRNWLRNVREVLYQCLGQVHTLAPSLYGYTHLCSVWMEAMLKDVQHLSNRDCRILLRHIVHPLMKNTPVQHRDLWLMPVLRCLLPHMHTRLQSCWSRAASPPAHNGSTTNTTEDAAAANEEVIQSRILAELTREHVTLLAQLHEKAGPQGQETLLEWLLQREKEVAYAAVSTAATALSWPDTAMQTAAQVCRAIVALGLLDTTLYSFIGSTMLRHAIEGLALDVCLPFQADVLQVIRDILMQQIGKAPGPSQVLLLLPNVDEGKLRTLEAKLKSTGSEKEQRNAIKQLLMASGGAAFMGLPRWNTATKPSSITIAEPTIRVPKPAQATDDSPTALRVSQLFNSLLEGSIVL